MNLKLKEWKAEGTSGVTTRLDWSGRLFGRDLIVVCGGGSGVYVTCTSPVLVLIKHSFAFVTPPNVSVGVSMESWRASRIQIRNTSLLKVPYIREPDAILFHINGELIHGPVPSLYEYINGERNHPLLSASCLCLFRSDPCYTSPSRPLVLALPVRCAVGPVILALSHASSSSSFPTA